jgi:hypothetical protein
VRRVFWAFLGLGAGIAGTVMAMRFARRQSRRLAPATIGREAKTGLMDLAKLVTESISEGERAMQERERELKASGPRRRAS